jgi:hypothetical protein
VQIILAFLVCLCGLGHATVAWAQEGATVRADPLSLEIGAGSTAELHILVEDVTDLYGFEFEITFDPTVLEVVDADPAREGVQIRPGDFLSPDWELENTVDNEGGTIAYALSQRSPSEPVSGDGILTVITWRGKAVGTSPITLAHVLLAAPGGVEVPANAEDGRIVVVAPDAAPADTPTTAETTTPSSATAAPTATPIPPTSTLPATSGPEATQSPTAQITSAAPGAATPTGSTALTTVEPTSIAAAQAAPTTEGESSLKPSPTTVSSSGSSGVSSSTLIYIAVACLVAGAGALLFALTLRRRK